jgi:thiol-disulfide isomerase/thioredoxin
MKEVLNDSHNKVWLLWFYAPWCEHCKVLAPKYEQAAHQVKGLRFAKIDGTWGPSKGIATRYGVSGYPSIKWIRDGHVRPYRGSQE